MKAKVLDQATVLHFEGSILDETSLATILSFYETESINWTSPHLIADLSQLNVINSSGINVLIRLLTKTRIKGGEMIIIGLHENVGKVLQLTKLNDVFIIKENLDQAINILKQTT